MNDVKAWLKEYWLVLLVAIASFSLLVVIWPHTPMYKAVKEQQRDEAIAYLSINYWETRFPDLKQRIMEDFHLTDADINPMIFWERAEQELNHNVN
jgi:hypothetical protein